MPSGVKATYTIVWTLITRPRSASGVAVCRSVFAIPMKSSDANPMPIASASAAHRSRWAAKATSVAPRANALSTATLPLERRAPSAAVAKEPARRT